MSRSFLCLLLTSLACHTCAAAPPWEGFRVGDTVAVVTHAGRTLRGEIDPRSTDRALWLTTSAEGVTVTSRTAAQEVARVRSASAVTLPPVWEEQEAPSLDPTFAAPAVNHVSVRSLEVFAKPANWDADPQADGVRLWVQPLGQDNLVTPVAGTVRVELLLEHRGEHGQRSFRVAESWRHAISPEAFTSHGAVIELPFRTVVPEEVTAQFPLAVLQVRLQVPGEGAFDAMVSDLPLRTVSWNRDQQQQRTGSRFLPGEPR